MIYFVEFDQNAGLALLEAVVVVGGAGAPEQLLLVDPADALGAGGLAAELAALHGVGVGLVDEGLVLVVGQVVLQSRHPGLPVAVIVSVSEPHQRGLDPLIGRHGPEPHTCTQSVVTRAVNEPPRSFTVLGDGSNKVI